MKRLENTVIIHISVVVVAVSVCIKETSVASIVTSPNFLVYNMLVKV